MAQSPQIYKQMMITADYDRVYEIGPVFRAEDSNTYRHMTEFIGLDLEMGIEEHYHEVLDLFDELFVSLFKGLETRFSREIEHVRQYYGGEPFKYKEKTLRLNFEDAIALLKENGVQLVECEALWDL